MSFRIKQELPMVYSYKFICVYVVSFYANITKIGTRSYHCRFSQSKPDKESHLLYKFSFQLGVANRHLSRVLNTVITDKIVMTKITELKMPFSTFSFTERQ